MATQRIDENIRKAGYRALGFEALPITPSVLTWARERAGYSIEEARKYFRKISAWEEGIEAPTYPQLEQLAEKFKCPVGLFFFPEPPELPSIGGSFRTLSPDEFAEIPRTVRTFIRRAQAMQVNLYELNDGENPSERLITRFLKFKTSDSVEMIASAIRDYLGVTIADQSQWRDPEVALEAWREIFANVGVFVFKDAFRADGYFGFCLHDDKFPIIYVNNTSTKTRQIFTLFHELGHLLFHTSGVDLTDDSFVTKIPEEYRRIEIICNGLAANVLVPHGELTRMLRGRTPDRAAAADIAEYFAVSREVIYRQFFERGLINQGEYFAAAEEWKSQIKKKPGGGSYYNSHISYLGHRYIDLAFARYYQNRFDEKRLAEYLNVKPKNVTTFESKIAGRL